MVLKAYRLGVFPMSESLTDTNIHWIRPKERGIIPLEQFHVSKSLEKLIKKKPFEVTINRAFNDIISLCATPSAKRKDSWINPSIMKTYIELHKMGYANSIECWQNDKLAGGLYGVAINGVFFGESMVSLVSNASKIALYYLVKILKKQGFSLLDTQFITPHLAQFGAITIAHQEYMYYLGLALKLNSDFPSGGRMD